MLTVVSLKPTVSDISTKIKSKQKEVTDVNKDIEDSQGHET